MDTLEVELNVFLLHNMATYLGYQGVKFGLRKSGLQMEWPEWRGLTFWE